MRYHRDRAASRPPEHRQVRAVDHKAQVNRLFATLSAGGTPAVPVRCEHLGTDRKSARSLLSWRNNLNYQLPVCRMSCLQTSGLHCKTLKLKELRSSGY